MNTCKECKHWRRGGYLDHEKGIFQNLEPKIGEFMGYFNQDNQSKIICITDEKSVMGICFHEKMRSDYIDNWLNKKSVEEISDGLVCSDYDERSHFDTGQDFGCIQWEKKE